MEFLEKNKKLVIAGGVAIALGVVAFVMAGGGDTSASGNAKVDNSKAVTTSQDKLDNGAVKLGNVGSVGGNLDLSKHNDNSKN